MGKATKYKGVLPKNAKIGSKTTRTIPIKGNMRKITWQRIKPGMKKGNKKSNLKWKIVSNKKA